MDKIKKTMILFGLYLLVFIAGISIVFMLCEEITGSDIISMIFSTIAFICLAAANLYLSVSDIQKSIQNTAIVTVSMVYFLVALIASLVLALLGVETKVHIVLEVIIMVAGITAIGIMIMAKRHIESQ